MNKYYIVLIGFSVLYIVMDIAEYLVLKKVRKIDFKNYFDYKFNYKSKMKQLKQPTNSNAGDNDKL